MENNANQLQNQPMLCKKNCGFFGNPSCDGYCSKCYKDHVKKQNTGSAAGRVTPTTSLSTNNNNNSEIKINHESTVTSTTASPFSSSAAAVASAATHSIPIPARQQSSKLNEDFGMSVPVDMPAISTTSSTGQAVASSLGGSENMMACSVDETSTSPLACSMGAEKKKRTRCSVESCKRKVGLTGFDCRCGGLFCWEHRYSDKHECKFDYKELGQDQIRKNNPVVVGEKIQKI